MKLLICHSRYGTFGALGGTEALGESHSLSDELPESESVTHKNILIFSTKLLEKKKLYLFLL